MGRILCASTPNQDSEQSEQSDEDPEGLVDEDQERAQKERERMAKHIEPEAFSHTP